MRRIWIIVALRGLICSPEANSLDEITPLNCISCKPILEFLQSQESSYFMPFYEIEETASHLCTRTIV